MSKLLMTYVVLGVTAVGVWLFFVLVPHRQKKQMSTEQIKQAERQLADYERIRTELPAFLATSQNLGTVQEEMVSKLYAKGDIIALFEELQRRSGAHGLVLAEIRPSVEELLELNALAPSPDNPMFLHITLRFQGGFEDFGRYVNSLENEHYFRGITLCQVQKHEEANGLHHILSFKALLGSAGETT